MPRIEAVTFDFSSTLAVRAVSSRKLERAALKGWLDAHGARVQSKSLRGIRSTAAQINAVCRCGENGDGAALATDFILGALGLSLPDEDRAELEALLDELDLANRYRIAEGAADALGFLRSRGVRLGIVTNRGSSIPGFVLRRELERIGLARYFRPAAISCSDEVGARKPDPKIFLTSLRAVRATPDRAAHVGDRKLEDVVGPRRLGMGTVRYTGFREDDVEGPDADAVIAHYAELPKALGF